MRHWLITGSPEGRWITSRLTVVLTIRLFLGKPLDQEHEGVPDSRLLHSLPHAIFNLLQDQMKVVRYDPVERKCSTCWTVVHLQIDDLKPAQDKYMGRHYVYECPTCKEACNASWYGTPYLSLPECWERELKRIHS